MCTTSQTTPRGHETDSAGVRGDSRQVLYVGDSPWTNHLPSPRGSISQPIRTRLKAHIHLDHFQELYNRICTRISTGVGPAGEHGTRHESFIPQAFSPPCLPTYARGHGSSGPSRDFGSSAVCSKSLNRTFFSWNSVLLGKCCRQRHGRRLLLPSSTCAAAESCDISFPMARLHPQILAVGRQLGLPSSTVPPHVMLGRRTCRPWSSWMIPASAATASGHGRTWSRRPTWFSS